MTNIGRLWTGSEVWSNAAIVTQDDRIAWIGPASELPASVPGVIGDIVDVDHVENLGGALVTPGLIDAHTHPVYAGNRWAELAMRSGGSSPSEIVAAGGGVASTVTVTRGTDPWTLCSGVRERLRCWLRTGTTTVEAKTGYHLTRDGELADVRLLRSLENEPGMPRVHVTFLAANALPPEYFGRRADYVDAVASWCADAAAAGADSIDAHCGDGRFSAREAGWILGKGRAAGLLPRLHASGGERSGAARLAAELGCASADVLLDRRGCGGAGELERGRRGLPGPGGRRQASAAGQDAAGQGRAGCAGIGARARRERHHLHAAGHQPGGRELRHERDRGAAGRDGWRRPGAAGAGPGHDVPRKACRHRGLGRRPRGRLRLVLRREADPDLAGRRARHGMKPGALRTPAFGRLRAGRPGSRPSGAALVAEQSRGEGRL
jgi:imidazolonepropionase-like amidohydrolase